MQKSSNDVPGTVHFTCKLVNSNLATLVVLFGCRSSSGGTRVRKNQES